jgi:hypothetical protein
MVGFVFLSLLEGYGMYRTIHFLAITTVATIFGIVLGNFLPPQSGWLVLCLMWAVATVFASLFVNLVVHTELD